MIEPSLKPAVTSDATLHRHKLQRNLRPGRRIQVIVKSIVLALLLTAMAYAYPEMSAQELKALLGKNLTILDCNGTDSYNEEHIPGAVDYLGGYLHLGRLLPKDKKALIVAYWGGSQCPMYKLGADDARRLGYTNIRHLSSGLQGWKQLGYPVTPGLPK